MVEQAKRMLSRFLGISNDLADYWDIIDGYPRTGDCPEIVLLHYNPDMKPDIRSHEPLLDVRGVIVDVKTGAIISKAFGYNKVIVCHDPIQEDDENYLISTITKTYNYSAEEQPEEVPKETPGIQKFSKSSPTYLYPGGESTIVRFFKWKGKVFFSTYKKIEGESSRWGDRHTFGENFYKLMPDFDPESLFGPEDYSPYTFVFLVNDINTRVISSVRDNRVHFLAAIKTWEEKDYPMYLPEGQTEIPMQGIPNLRNPEPPLFENQFNKPMRFQPKIDVNIANKVLFPRDFATPVPNEFAKRCKPSELILEYSQTEDRILDVYLQDPENDPNDPNLKGGDSVMLYTKEGDGKLRVYRLDSPSYPYRDMVTGSDHNIYHNFVIRMETFMGMTLAELRETFPVYSPEVLGLIIPKPVDKKRKVEDPMNIPENRRKWWLRILYDALSPDYKDDVAEYLERYHKDIKMVADFILKKSQNLSDEEKRHVGEKSQQRFADLISQAKAARSREGKQDSMSSLIAMLYRESGNSVYKMITTVKAIKKARSASESVQLPAPPADLPSGIISFQT